jgi:hypothetical protein
MLNPHNRPSLPATPRPRSTSPSPRPRRRPTPNSSTPADPLHRSPTMPAIPSSHTPSHTIPRRPHKPNPPPAKAPPSKINLLDLPTETTTQIFRHAHKPNDFHFLLPSGAGPLRPRKYNLPLTVCREWYRRARPVWFERLRLNWLRVPDFVEAVQRYDVGRFVKRVDVRVQGKELHRAFGTKKLSSAQMALLVLQYVDLPVGLFGLVFGGLECVKDLTLRFSDCRGDEVSMQCKSLPLLSPLVFYIYMFLPLLKCCSLMVADNCSYCVGDCQFTSLRREFVSRLRSSNKTVRHEPLYRTHLSHHPKTRHKPQIHVSLMPLSRNSPQQTVIFLCARI